MQYKVKMTIVKNIEANSSKDAANIASNCLDEIFGKNILGYEVEAEFKAIMDTSNNHDEELVKMINKCYNHDNKRFNLIVNTLAMRDLKECEDKGISLPITDEYDYLMHVADDEDLMTIISFVRPRKDGKMMFVGEMKKM